MPVQRNMSGVASYNAEQNKQARACLRDALSILMRQKPYDSISVTELCDKAGVSRSAFYSNFGTLGAVFKEIAQSLISEITEKIEVLQRHNSLAWYERFFALVEQNIEIYQIIAQSPLLLEKYLEVSNEIILDHDWLTEKDRIHRLAFNGAIQNATFRWIRDGRKESAQTIAAWCYEFLG